MTEKEKDVIGALKDLMYKTAKKNGWEDFYNYHIRIVPECAKIILDLNCPHLKEADEFIVMAGAWLHDIALANEPRCGTILQDHHIKGYEIAKMEMLRFGINEEKTEIIAQCVLRHRNNEEYPATTSEQKVIAAADSMSHLKSIVHLTLCYYDRKSTLAEIINYGLEKLERDWRDILMIPEVAELCRKEYEVLKSLYSSYL